MNWVGVGNGVGMMMGVDDGWGVAVGIEAIACCSLMSTVAWISVSLGAHAENMAISRRIQTENKGNFANFVRKMQADRKNSPEFIAPTLILSIERKRFCTRLDFT